MPILRRAGLSTSVSIRASFRQGAHPVPRSNDFRGVLLPSRPQRCADPLRRQRILPHPHARSVEERVGDGGHGPTFERPNVSTTAELGYPGMVMENWYGILAPAGLLPALRTTLETAILM